MERHHVGRWTGNAVSWRLTAEPTIGKAINGGFDLFEAKCNYCDRISLVPLRSLTHPVETPVWKLEAALYCGPCSEGKAYSRRQRARILAPAWARPDTDREGVHVKSRHDERA